MANRPQDWIVAAACCEGPRPCVTLADMPRAHRRDMLGVAFAAVASSAYFITLGILMQPIPSRSLAVHVLLPNPTSSHAVLLDAIPAAPAPLRLRRLPNERPLQPLASAQFASMTDTPAATRNGSVATEREHRASRLSRLVRGVFRTKRPKLATG